MAGWLAGCMSACLPVCLAQVRRVIVRSPNRGRDFLSPSHWLQMAGRGGRNRIDSCGAAYLISDRNDKARAGQLVVSEGERIVSCLSLEMVMRMVLAVVRLGMCKTLDDVVRALSTFTFYGRTVGQTRGQPVSQPASHSFGQATWEAASEQPACVVVGSFITRLLTRSLASVCGALTYLIHMFRFRIHVRASRRNE
eukprot:GHVU01033398.1.p1 GENE.GHVU01033398.1~~GHVU01033398.1.p1  ORF type:complete len:196 (-),score=7.51 GHVU01033398.1:64-651(-)